MTKAEPAPPLVSVILPVRNRERTLARAVRSVLEQGLGDLELIVVDDGSTDGTPALLQQLAEDPRVKLLAGTGSGAAKARNLGLAAARGRLLAFQDSDDEWRPQKLERAVAALEGTGPDTAVFYSNMTQVLPDGRQVDFPAPEVTAGNLIDESTMDYQVRGIGIQSAVIKRECVETAGGFDEALPRFIDLELFARLALRYRFVRSPEALVDYHHGPGISTDTAALVTARRYLLRKYMDRLRTEPRHLAWQYLHLAEALAKNGEHIRSAGWIARAGLKSPGAIRLSQLGAAFAGKWSRTRPVKRAAARA